MKKKAIFICVLIIVFALVIFFLKFNYKKIKFGNNESNKSVDEVKEYILNINSYVAKLEVTVNSNKNVNKYILKQEVKSKEFEQQTVEKPENIEGVTIIYNNGNLEIKNSKLNLSKIYNEYPYIYDNSLWLNSFINSCNEKKDKIKVYEENEEIIIELDDKESSKRKLYVEKGTGKPKKMLVQDNIKRNTIYILYKEIEINN